MSNLSLGGLSSGMDTQAIIDQLVAIERKPIYRAQEEISELKAEKDAWRDINSRLDSLANKLTDLKLSATYNSNTTSSSNESIATASTDNTAVEATYNLDITNLAKVHRVSSDKQTDSTSDLNYNGDIGINGKLITIEETDSLNDIMNKINETADLGAKATIIDNNLVIESSVSGTANEMTFTDNSNILEDIGILDSTKNIKNELQTAQDASLSINGVTVSSSTNNISEAVNGVDFNIKDSGTAEITVKKDTQKTTTAIQSFVDQYNSVMNFIDSKVAYDSETNKAGVLQGNNTLLRLQSNLRRMVSDTVNTSSNYDQLAIVGISIDRDGVMSFDSSKLKEALEDSPQDVINLFKAEKDDEGFNGVATRLDSYVDQLIQSGTGTIPRQLDYYDDRVENLNEDIEDYERQIEQIRDRYTQQFTAMEKAISEMQSQQSWMMSQLTSLGSNANMLNNML